MSTENNDDQSVEKIDLSELLKNYPDLRQAIEKSSLSDKDKKELLNDSKDEDQESKPQASD